MRRVSSVLALVVATGRVARAQPAPPATDEPAAPVAEPATHPPPVAEPAPTPPVGEPAPTPLVSVPAPPPALPAAPARPAEPAPALTGHDRRLIALDIGGAGVLALGVALWAGLDARSTRDRAQMLGCSDDLSACPPGEALTTANDAYSQGNFATGFFLGGTVVIGAAIVLWLTAPDDRPAGATAWRVTPAASAHGTALVVGRGF